MAVNGNSGSRRRRLRWPVRHEPSKGAKIYQTESQKS
jgi:hypothetical protein